jgi:hypothetical protein
VCSYLKWLEENRKNVKATAQMTSVLPDGPPPRAAIGSSKGTVRLPSHLLIVPTYVFNFVDLLFIVALFYI